ncbi:MAG: hypothetical protein AB7R89_34675 [Dehalococcoidia bacterium]
MTTEEYRMATGIAAIVATCSLLYLLYWQLRIWPDDRQKWAATVFVGMTLLVVGQLCASYLGIAPAMGAGPRGAISFILWAMATFGLAWESHLHIQRHIGNVERLRREARDRERWL